MTAKRAAAFYRVSTKGQLDENEILLQRRACRAYITRAGWTLVKEYTERGVSGYKVPTERRDEIQRAKHDAENGLYDVLLCFMFDRLGRRMQETPLLLEWFDARRIEVWSVKEGRQLFVTQEDNLANALRFAESGRESDKTSFRVNEKHVQMAQDGLYRGGSAPFGYALVNSGLTNKKGKDLMALALDDVQAACVRQIFDWVKHDGYGSGRIAKSLNEQGITTAAGSKWNAGSINFILRNPIYKGYPAYGKRTSKEGVFETKTRQKWILPDVQQKHLVIVDEPDFDHVQAIRSARSVQAVKKADYNCVNLTTHPLLFVGLIRCGFCDSPLTTTYNSKTYRLKSGETRKWRRAVYRCSGKALQKTDCTGQTLYSQNKIEDSVLRSIDQRMRRMKKIDYVQLAREYGQPLHISVRHELEVKNANLRSAYAELQVLKAEVAKSLIGSSVFAPELLNELIGQKDKELQTLDDAIRALEADLKTQHAGFGDIEDLSASLEGWLGKFNELSYEQQKIRIRRLVEIIRVYKNFAEVTFKPEIATFLSHAGNGPVSELLELKCYWK